MSTAEQPYPHRVLSRVAADAIANGASVFTNEPAPAIDRFSRAELRAIADAIQALEFNVVFTIDPATGAVSPLGYDAPSVYHDPNGDVTIDGHGEWRAMTGLTGQDRYRDAVMHASEVMGGSWGVVATMLDEQGDEPTVWAQVIVDVIDCDEDTCDPPGEGCPGGHEPAGWAIVYRRRASDEDGEQ